MRIAFGKPTRLSVAAAAFAVLAALLPIGGGSAQAAEDTHTKTQLTGLRTGVYGVVSHLQARVTTPTGVLRSGTVMFFDNGLILGAIEINGSTAHARLDTRLHFGTHELFARYLGEPGLEASDSNMIRGTITAAEARMFTAIENGGSNLNHRSIVVMVRRVTSPPPILTPRGVLHVKIDRAPELLFRINGNLTLPQNIPPKGQTVTIRFSFVPDFGDYTAPPAFEQVWSRP